MELALVCILLFLILFGIVEVGLLFRDQAPLSQAAREGARSAAVGTTTATIKLRIIAAGIGTRLATSNIALDKSADNPDRIVLRRVVYHQELHVFEREGLVKNALDTLEDLRSDPRPYFDGRAVGCIVAAFGAQAGGSTLATLRSIVHALRGWPTPLGAALNSSSGLFDADGAFSDPKDAWAVEMVAKQVVEFARARGGA